MIRSSSKKAFQGVQQAGQAVSRRSYASIATTVGKDTKEIGSITTLPNGMRVATEELAGPFTGVGVYIDAGSRYENEYLSGVSHIMDRLAFKSTTKRSADQLLESMEMLGGNIQCASSRESIMYQAATFNASVPETLAVLAETIRNPRITSEEIEQQVETAHYEISEIWSKPELILPELVHVAAYRKNTLGNPLLCPKERLHFINRDVIEAYRKSFYLPERMVVAFAGVPRDEALKLAEQYFGDMVQGQALVLPSPQDALPEQSAASGTTSTPTYGGASSSQQKGFFSNLPFIKNLSTSASSAASVLNDPFLDYSPSFELPNLSLPAKYTGGYMALPTAPLQNPNLPTLTHIHLCFEAPAITSPDIYAVAVLQTLLGGGGSFSAGGPGKGMYSRLYTNVLNQHGWVESCVAFNHGYSDSGVFGIASSCVPSQTPRMLDVMCQQLKSLYLETGRGSLGSREVERAKNQLRSNLLMNLESRMVELEDLGRQVQTHGRKISAMEMCNRIDQVSVKDLKRVSRQMFEGKIANIGGGSGAPTVVVQQQGDDKPAFKGGWTEIQERIQKWNLGRR